MYYIYSLKKGEEIVYIGRTNNIARRMHQHKSEKSKEYHCHEVLYERKELESACRVEDKLIKKLTPKYNKATNEHGHIIHFEEMKIIFNLSEEYLDDILFKLRINPIFKDFYKQITEKRVKEFLLNG